MDNNDTVQGLGLTCPEDSAFYICPNDRNRFIGCCGVNPCGARKGLCPDQHLREASFDRAYEGYIRPQACTNDNVDVAWHSCSWSTSSFIGCCAVDPCLRRGCPSKELRAARLSNNTKDAEVFLGDGQWYSAEPSPAPSADLNPFTSMSVGSDAVTATAFSSFQTSVTSEATSVADTSIVSTTPPSEILKCPKNQHCLNNGGVAGIVLSVFIFLAISGFCVWWKSRCRKNRARGNANQPEFREPSPSPPPSSLPSPSQHSTPQPSPSLPSSRASWDQGPEILDVQPRTPEMDQTTNYSRLPQVPQISLPEPSHQNNRNPFHGLAQTLDQTEAAQQHQRLQTRAAPMRFRAPAPFAAEYLLPESSNASTRGRLTPSSITDRYGRNHSHPAELPATELPASSTVSNTENGNGSLACHSPPTYSDWRASNGTSSSRSSGSSSYVTARSSLPGSNNPFVSAITGLDSDLLPPIQET
ncbi:hypothetical protein FLONG3_5776 [Fusarium longipes]|uniref:Uncharacterized protein n=1 Tax=Fusarium longipes TaxID=694270 RepID=A0A395SSQ7_9HYPO|nr:hypothetical protein FLONG3_5776 [Fusarium longipes]